jgi:hypothetical protein
MVFAIDDRRRHFDAIPGELPDEERSDRLIGVARIEQPLGR